jgi:hypothetical protein
MTIETHFLSTATQLPCVPAASFGSPAMPYLELDQLLRPWLRDSFDFKVYLRENSFPTQRMICVLSDAKKLLAPRALMMRNAQSLLRRRENQFFSQFCLSKFPLHFNHSQRSTSFKVFH